MSPEAAIARPRPRLPRVAPVFLVLLVLCAAIAVLNPQFLAPAGFMAFVRRTAPLAILATGQLFVIVSGGFDLAVGSIISFTVLGSALMLQADAGRTGAVIALMAALGGLVGLVNGAVVSWLKVPSIIATLGMLLAIKGAGLMWSGGSPQGYLPDAFRYFGRANLTGVPLVGLVPVSLILLVALAAVAAWLLHGTGFGRQLLAVGDNPRAAELAGVRVPAMRMAAFVISALSAVAAGVLLGGFAGVSTGVGDGYELQAITAVVFGGARLLGGRGSVPATVAGAFSLSALFTLLNLLAFPKPLRDAAQGLILIAAVAYSMLPRHGRG